VNANTDSGGLFYLQNCAEVLFENDVFNTSGGSGVGGVLSLITCGLVRAVNLTFNNTYVKSGGGKGGAIYAELKIESAAQGNRLYVIGGIFNHTQAPLGLGGSVYLKFVEVEGLEIDGSDFRTDFYNFSSTLFVENDAINGTSVFVEACELDSLVTHSTFDVETTISGAGVNEFVGLDKCGSGPGITKSISLLLIGSEDPSLILVSGNNLICDKLNSPRTDSVVETCNNLSVALESGSGVGGQNLIIEIIDSADLNDAVNLFGNVVVISPVDMKSYVVLVIGLNGIIYLESGHLNSGWRRSSNEAQGADLSLTMMDIKLAYKTASVTHPLFVVIDGIVSFTDCLFSSGSSDESYPSRVSVYIADVTNRGKLVLSGGVVSELEVEGNFLVRALDESTLEIEVCLVTLFST
jgi:hypothetical protein